MKRIIPIILVCALFLSTVCSLCAAAEPYVAAQGRITLPVSADGANGSEQEDGSLLIGWSAPIDGGTVFLAPGAEYDAPADMTFTPVFLGLALTPGAAVRTLSPAGLRFTASVDEADYQTLCATGAVVTFGTLIAPTDTIDGEFTEQALSDAGKQYLKIQADFWWQITNTERTYTAVIADILEQNYNRAFSAVAYVEITYTDGSVGTWYSAYDPEQNSRSVYEVACAALGDDGYSDEAYALFQTYFDKVGVDLTITEAQIGATPEQAQNNIANSYYSLSSKWTCQFADRMHDTFLADRGYQITVTVQPYGGAAITEQTKLRLNGAPLEKGYTITNGNLTIIRRYPLGDYTWAY